MCRESLFLELSLYLRNGLTNFQLEGGFWYLHFKGFKKVFYARDDISLIYEVSKIILKMVARRANLPELKKKCAWNVDIKNVLPIQNRSNFNENRAKNRYLANILIMTRFREFLLCHFYDNFIFEIFVFDISKTMRLTLLRHLSDPHYFLI